MDLDGQGNFVEGRIDIDLGSIIVGSDLELNWGSYSSWGGASLLIRRDLQWTKEISTKSICEFFQFGRAVVPQ